MTLADYPTLEELTKEADGYATTRRDAAEREAQHYGLVNHWGAVYHLSDKLLDHTLAEIRVAQRIRDAAVQLQGQTFNPETGEWEPDELDDGTLMPGVAMGW